MVGIVSCYFKMNYGSMLQAFATQEILDQLGVENETINICGIKSEISADKRRYYLRNTFNLSMYHAKQGFVRHIIQRKLDPKEFGTNIDIRRQAFQKFEREHFRLSKISTSKNQLSEVCQAYSSVLLGSDQLWLPLNIEGDYYTLSFVPENVNKIAYATSFGVESIPSWQKGKTRKFLGRIEHLSVREQSGQKTINELIKKNVPVVCDPSLLLSKKQWLSLSHPQAISEKPYIFCYFLGSNPHHREFANRLKKKTGYPIVTLRHLDEYIPSDNTFGDIAPYDVGPLEFIHLINNAAYICTDSFHGTAFSILANKNFYAFRRFQKATKESTNNRVEDFLNTLGLKKRMLLGMPPSDNVIEDIDYTAVMKRLNNWRNQSMEYLTNALQMGGDT